MFRTEEKKTKTKPIGTARTTQNNIGRNGS